MTNQEAIDIIKRAIAEVEWEYPMEIAAALDKAVEALEKGNNVPGKWNSVKDGLPGEYGNYLAVVNGEVEECTYASPLMKGIISGWSTCEAGGIKWLRDEQVTHWMPLPEAPKEES